MRKLVIIGASGHGKVVADIAKKNGYREIVFLDDNENVHECNNYPIVGKIFEAKNMDADFFIGIGNADIRKRIQETLNRKHIVTLIHPDAVVAEDVMIGIGTAVMAGAVINLGTRIGRGCIINTCSSVDHDCAIGDFVHISVGVHIAGTCKIGEKTWIGAGATVSNNVSICDNCMIGAGAVVLKDIRNSGTYVGIPARRKDMIQKTDKSFEKDIFLNRKK